MTIDLSWINKAIEIALLISERPYSRSEVDGVKIQGNEIYVLFSGYCRGSWEDSVQVTLEQLNQSMEEVKIQHNTDLALRKEKEEQQLLKRKRIEEVREKKKYEELKQKYG